MTRDSLCTRYFTTLVLGTESTLSLAFILIVYTSAGDCSRFGRYNVVPYLLKPTMKIRCRTVSLTCQQYLQTVLHIVAIGAESGNVVQLTQNESNTVVHYK
jgi:hypothetical protein